jgi:hypothetical protein
LVNEDLKALNRCESGSQRKIEDGASQIEKVKGEMRMKERKEAEDQEGEYMD